MSTDAENTKRSKTNPEPNLVQPSEQDVVPRSSTAIETQSSDCGCTDSEKLFILTALLNQLAYDVQSQDIWLQAYSVTKKFCLEAGLDEQMTNEVLAPIAQAVEDRRRSNPLSSMF